MRLLAAATGAFPVSRWSSNASHADEFRYPATLFVWGRWLIFIVSVFLLIYRPEFILFDYVAYMFFLALLAGLNGYVHYGLRSGRTLTLRWMLALSATDVVMITAGMVVGGGFSNYFFYLLYYPALAGFAVFFSSLQAGLRMGDHGGRYLCRRQPYGWGRVSTLTKKRKGICLQEFSSCI